jgi:hypothetical protein
LSVYSRPSFYDSLMPGRSLERLGINIVTTYAQL